jgi:hypothetical protein
MAVSSRSPSAIPATAPAGGRSDSSVESRTGRRTVSAALAEIRTVAV